MPTEAPPQAPAQTSDIFLYLIAIVLPPVAVALKVAFGLDFFINIILTILGFLPGIIHAWFIIARNERITGAGGPGNAPEAIVAGGRPIAHRRGYSQLGGGGAAAGSASMSSIPPGGGMGIPANPMGIGAGGPAATGGMPGQGMPVPRMGGQGMAVMPPPPSAMGIGAGTGMAPMDGPPIPPHVMGGASHAAAGAGPMMEGPPPPGLGMPGAGPPFVVPPRPMY